MILRISFLSLALSGAMVDGKSSSQKQNIDLKVYQTKSAKEKSNILWERIENTQYSKLPTFEKLGLFELIRMSRQSLSIKAERDSDFSPKGWVKYLHRRGSVAKVKFKSKGEHPYTGAFKGFDYGLLRLSLTSDPGKNKAVAPGLALKILRDGIPSANVSALYTIDGQGRNFNFFEYPLSNIVVPGSGIGPALVHRLFSSLSSAPEELKVKHFAEFGVTGEEIQAPKAPRHIFFVPNSELSFSLDSHDVRNDFNSLEKGTLIYQVHALPLSESVKYSQFKESMIKELVKKSQHLGDLYLESSFVSSSFGDDGLFFRHEIVEK